MKRDYELRLFRAIRCRSSGVKYRSRRALETAIILEVDRDFYRPHLALVMKLNLLHIDGGRRRKLDGEMFRLTAASLVALEFPALRIDPILRQLHEGCF